MITLTKEKLAELLREAYERGAVDADEFALVGTNTFYECQERAIQPLVHRSSGDHEDHGREVK